MYHSRELVKILRHLSFTDVWVYLHNDHFEPTRTSTTTASRIDRVYLPDLLLPSLEDCSVLKLPSALQGKTDHAPLAVTVRGKPGPAPNNTSWRIDSALLEDEESVERIKERLQASIESMRNLNPEEWDKQKETWKGILQEEGRTRKRRLTAEINETLRRMQIIKNADTLTFCTNGSISRDSTEIEQIFREHFKAQFGETEAGDTATVRGKTEELCQALQRIDEEEVSSICEEVTIEEIRCAIGNMPPNSAPGVDGLAASFYATFLETVGEALVAVVNTVIKQHKKPASFGKGRIVLILKAVTMVKVLGVYFSGEGVAAPTWQKALERAKQAAARIQQVDLTLREKALAIKTSVCAFAGYASRVAVIPSRIAVKLNKVTNNLMWNGKPPPVKRNLLQLPETSGGLGLPHVMTTCKIRALKTARSLYQAPEYTGKNLLMYWCSTNNHFLGADRHPGPQAEFPSAFYKAAANKMKMLAKEAPTSDVDKDPAARIVEMVTFSQLSPEEKQKIEDLRLGKAKMNRSLPHEVHEFNWKRIWKVLPTRERLHHLGIVPSARCPNCRCEESQQHALFECIAAKPIWRLVARRCEDPGPRLLSQRPPERPQPPPATRRLQYLLSQPSTSVQPVLHDTSPTTTHAHPACGDAHYNGHQYRAPDETLSNALAQYGKVKSITFATVASRHNKLNGVRVVKLQVTRPVPNFVTIAGHRVMCEYRGMRRVCAWCGDTGHMASACTAKYCKRCGTFGHEKEGCDAECKRTPPHMTKTVPDYWDSEGQWEMEDARVAPTPPPNPNRGTVERRRHERHKHGRGPGNG
ncbi:hypothetical protein HPB52_023343 [Rhipicephalus sanguineus]|uniref:Reverse transcriptase zinc-binding domain-containing protein n=1 Tax=Rhipicephalus sanguineus TaxID=34632 RepID=A0A9D4T6F6_RHISA|nr:hypothetical protein HPB52_023343 [Rhipicephalus sanguineus]